MSKKRFRRGLSLTLAMAITASMMTTGMVANAGDTLPYLGDAARGENQPFQHGYRAEDLLDWSPETDPYSEMLRAQVPLQERNERFAATQANPDLDPNVEYFTLTGDYGNAFFDSYPYTNEFSQHLFNFWQYADYYASWHGMPTLNVPESMYDAEGERNGTSDWQKRNFEFGMMNLPNPAYTNAAHKNGVLSLGCIFQPRAYQHYEKLLVQDEEGNFPVAEKLIELTKYYGFDGWFFNMEGRSISDENQALLGKMFKRMRDAGLYVQWYTADSSFGAHTAKYLTSATPEDLEDPERRAESVFLDYGWNNGAAANAAKYGLDPLKAVFGGVEAGRDRWTCDTRYFNKAKDSKGNMLVSIASLGTDFVQTGLNDDTGIHMAQEKDEYQWMSFQRERLWWTGAASPDGPNAGLTGEDIGSSKMNFAGVSSFKVENSVVSGDTFVTSFNTGHGLEYLEEGVLSNDKEWSNITIQDILPTWQWWFDSEGAKLSAEFDYGSQYQKTLKDGTEGSFGFDRIGGYNGGSSLAVYGALDAKNFMHLYKTDLAVKDNSKMDITFQKSSDDAASMQLGVIFESDPDNVVELGIANSAAKSGGWVTSTVDLSAYAGEQIAAFGLVFDGTSAGYQMNIGQMKYTSGEAQKPAAPTGLNVKKAYGTGEIVVAWEKAPYADVKQYNVYKVEDGKEIFLGGTYDETYYIKDVYDTSKEVAIALKAVSEDGTESDAASATYDYTKAVKDIEVTAQDGKLNVSWTGGQADVTVTTTDEAQPHTWTASGDGSAELAVTSGKEANGARYLMTITAENGVPATYEGRLDDSWSAPYDGTMKNIAWTSPTSKDWFKIHYYVNGSETESGSYSRGNGGDHSYFSSLPSNTTSLKVILEDYSGNLSDPVFYTFKDGQPIDLAKEISEEEIPDAVLRAYIKENIGATIGDVLNYTGGLDVSGLDVADLTGIKLISGITSMDISGTQVSDLTPLAGLGSLEALNASNTQITAVTGGMLPASLATIDLSGNTKLTSIEKGALSALKKAEALNITNNAALQLLCVDGMAVSAIDITGCDSITEIHAENAKIDTLDLSGMAKLETLILTDAEIGSLDLDGCTRLDQLLATDIDLAEIDITDCTALTRIDLNDSTLEKITAADGSAYTGIYRADFSGSKLDLSEGTPERQLMDQIDAYIAANPITPVRGDLENIALGTDNSILFDGNTSSGYYYISKGDSVTIDLGSEQTVKSWDVYAYDYSYYIPSGLKLEVSSDGTDYTQVGAEVTGNTNRHVQVSLNEDQYATGRYFRVTVTQGNYGYLQEIELYGNPVDPYGLRYHNQRPAARLQELPEALTVTTSKTGSIRLMDYFESCYDKAETVRGTLFSSLEGAEWIAADYNVPSQIALPKNAYIQITDENGNVINTPDAPDTPAVDTETNVALNATVLGGSGDNSWAGEGYAQLLDGNTATKWCTNGNSGWMAFYLPEEVSVGKWITTHAEINNEPASYNTEDFELQILNTEAAGMGEDEFLALSSSQQKPILSNHGMWTTIDHMTGNKSMVVDRDIDGADEAKVYRLKVNKSINGTSNAAVRIHELELYAADNVARDYDGVLALDKVGLYSVDFMKGKTVLASMDVRVRPVTSLLEDIIAEAERLEADGALKNTMEAVVNEFNAALQEAKDLLVKEGATQKEINDATLRLLSVIAKVDWKQGDKTVLEIAVELGQNIRENIDLYVEAGKQEFLDALAEAEALLASGNAWQDDIDNSVTRLTNAMKALRMAPNKDILNGMIANAKAMDLSAYTADSADAVRIALAMAQAVAADPDATQEAVDAAANTLDAALKGLVVASGDANANTDTPVGEGAKPTKTGDNGAASLALLALLSAGAVALLKKKQK